MALTNITTDSTQTLTLTFNVPTAVGTRRKLFALATQTRTPPDMTGITVDSVTGTQVINTTNAAGSRRVIGFEWLDTDLPAGSGNVTVRVLGTTGATVSTFFAASAVQSTSTLFGTMEDAGDNTTTISLSISGTTGTHLFGQILGLASTLSATTGQTVVMPTTAKGVNYHASGYTTAKYLQYAQSNNVYLFGVVAIEPYFGAGGTLAVTSVDADGEVYSTQADFGITGTGFSAGQTFTISGIACTELSFSGSTSVKLTAPNFISNNIKFGKVEFKVSD